jgi:LysR family transcriptional regulator, hydrogen peroxide-inducible genes activator
MNLQQLEYILAVDKHRHFAKAAEACFVTQPTLSMMIQKLESELGLKIFDRKKQPIQPTEDGKAIIDRARQIMADVSHLREYTQERKHQVSGEVRMAIIPTLAPYLLPLFLNSLMKNYPQLKVKIRELVTEDIVVQLKHGELDMGIMATPLHDGALHEIPVFHEEFFAYTADTEPIAKKKYVLPKDIDLSKLWILEEGHCLRDQIFNLCELKKKDLQSDRLHYQAGSLETLKNLVDNNQGITILPYLATLSLTKKQQTKIREFAQPKPVREISLVVNQNFPRKKIIEAMRNEIIENLPTTAPLLKKKVVNLV